MKSMIIRAFTAAMFAASSAWAAGGDPPDRAPAQPADPVIEKSQAAIAKRDWKQAQDIAHEYLGEAYLMAGNLDKAKEQLKVLDRLCFFSCDEYTMLRKAIADYEAKRAGK